MAVSIQGVLYSVGMDTANFNQGVNTVEALRKQMASNQAKYASAAIKDELKISNAIDARLKAEQKLEAAYASNATAKEVAKITKEIEKLQRAESKAISQGEKNQAQYQTALKRTQAEIAKAETATKSWGAKLGKLKGAVSGLGGLVAGAVSVGAIAEVANKLDAIAKRAKDIGVTASALKEISLQANYAGISAEKLDVGLKTLARTYGKDVKTAMIELAARAEKGTLSLAEANKYFGENALEMIRILEQGEAAVAKMFDAKGIDEAAAAAERFNDNLTAIKDVGFNIGAKIIEGWAYIVDFAKNDLFNGIGDAAYKRQQDALNKAQDLANARRKAETAKQEAEANARLAKLDELDAKLKSARQGEMSLVDQIINGQNDINRLKAESEKYDEDSVEYVKLYEQIINKTIALEAAQTKQRQQVADAAKKQADARQKEIDAAKKQAEEKAKSQAAARSDFELQLKIRTLEAKGRTDQAEAIKNALARNELMDKYGYSIAQATAALKAQKELERGGGVEYSEKDIAKAKKIIERGESGSVGKKTLEQAQAILSGKGIEGQAVSMFADVKAKSPELNVANLDRIQPTATSLAQKTQQDNTRDAQEQGNKISTQIFDILSDIKTSLGQYFNNQTTR